MAKLAPCTAVVPYRRVTQRESAQHTPSTKKDTTCMHRQSLFMFLHLGWCVAFVTTESWDLFTCMCMYINKKKKEESGWMG